MMMKYRRTTESSVAALVMSLLVLTATAAEVTDQRRDPSNRPADTAKPLKVIVLAGQANMEGHAQVRTFDYMDEAERLARFVPKQSIPHPLLRRRDLAGSW